MLLGQHGLTVSPQIQPMVFMSSVVGNESSEHVESEQLSNHGGVFKSHL